MKKLIFAALIFIAPLVHAQDTLYSIGKTQLMSKVTAVRSDLEAFTAELEGLRGKTLTPRETGNLFEKQDALNARVRWFTGLYDYFPDMTDDFRRELNFSMNVNSQNSGRINTLGSSKSAGNSTGFTALLEFIRPILIASHPEMELILNYFLSL